MVEQLAVNNKPANMKDRRAYKDRAAYLKQAVARLRKHIRERAIEYLGNVCCICGYSRCSNALDVHHRDPAQKDFGLSADGMTRSWARVEKELRKCVLLCANCHREIHAGQTQLPSEN